MTPTFFPTPADFRKWLEENHDKEKALQVGYYKVKTGKPSITWQESVEQALCFGWIDGVRNSIDDESYTIRFTPRKPRSNWSAVNIRTVEKLKAEGLMTPPGLEAYDKRGESNSEGYSLKEEVTLGKGYESIFKRNKKAWKNFCQMAPSYRKAASWWVISAKQEVTRLKRLDILIADSAAGLKIKEFRR